MSLTTKINIKDYHKISDTLNGCLRERMNGGPNRTKIVITDHNTGEILQTGSNKILVPGSQVTACKQFGLDQIVPLPTYNSLLDLENSFPDYETQPFNEPITCLWCVGRGGAGTSPNETLVVSNTDRIEPINDILPFRYVTADNDLNREQRAVYFGRHLFEDGHIGYYMKAFDTTPQLHIRYLDGTEVSPNMYNIDSSQIVEIYVEMRLSITRQDFRDYFDKVLGWDNADVSTISLLTSWYKNDITENPDAAPEDQIRYKWYQDIIPFSKWNFRSEELIDLTRAIDFNYQVYY